MSLLDLMREQEMDDLAHIEECLRKGEFEIMNEHEAKTLAERIRSQFPSHDVKAAQSADKRYWFVGVQRMDGGHTLTFRAAYEWEQALHILDVLKD